MGSSTRSNQEFENTPKAITGGRRIARQTRVERLKAHEEAQAEAKERLESMTEQEIATQHRMLAADERFALRQLVRQMKQVRGEAKRAEEEADQRAAALAAQSSRLSGSDSTGTHPDNEHIEPLERNFMLSSGTSLNGRTETPQSRQSHRKCDSPKMTATTIPNLNKCSDEMKSVNVQYKYIIKNVRITEILVIKLFFS